MRRNGILGISGLGFAGLVYGFLLGLSLWPAFGAAVGFAIGIWSVGRQLGRGYWFVGVLSGASFVSALIWCCVIALSSEFLLLSSKNEYGTVGLFLQDLWSEIHDLFGVMIGLPSLMLFLGCATAFGLMLEWVARRWQ